MPLLVAPERALACSIAAHDAEKVVDILWAKYLLDSARRLLRLENL